MPSKESSFTNMLTTLVVVTLVAALSLGFAYSWTKEPIKQAKLEKQKKSIAVVVAGYANDPVAEGYKVLSVNKKDSLEFFPAKKNGELIGTAIKTFSPNGYSGNIWLMVGLDKNGIINNISVIEHAETPGLGSKMTLPFFLNQFINKDPGRHVLRVKKDNGEIDAISGATITSRAFAEAVQLAYDTYRLHGNDQSTQ